MRQLREQAGISLMAAAEELEFSRARMYRIENGQVPVRKHDVIAMCTIYRASERMTGVLIGLAQEAKAKGWWHTYSHVVPAWFALYLGMEQAASRLRTFAPSLVPGLLQCREYAQTVVRRRLDGDRTAVDDAVAVRLQRQALLTRTAGPAVEVILDEGVLRRGTGDRFGMREQLALLVNVTTRPHVCVRVVPFLAGPHPAAASGQFTILEFPDTDAPLPEPTTVYCETLTGALYLDRAAEVAAYESAWADLRAAALSPDETNDLIAGLIKET
jgi:hypothetical protein